MSGPVIVGVSLKTYFGHDQAAAWFADGARERFLTQLTPYIGVGGALSQFGRLDAA